MCSSFTLLRYLIIYPVNVAVKCTVTAVKGCKITSGSKLPLGFPIALCKVESLHVAVDFCHIG